MQTLILWLLAVYGFISAWMYIRLWLYRSQHKVAVHYYLYTQNSQGIIEWIIRYLAELSKLEGRSFYFYVLDFGSEDDTLAIVERLRKHGLFIEIVDPSLGLSIQGKEDTQELAPREIKQPDKSLRLVIDLREHASAEQQAVS